MIDIAWAGVACMFFLHLGFWLRGWRDRVLAKDRMVCSVCGSVLGPPLYCIKHFVEVPRG